MRPFRNIRSNRGGPRPARRRAVRPAVEGIEGRLLCHAGASTAAANALAPYTVFEGTITRGPAAGLSLDGPIVLGYDGRIQVIGYLYEQGGPRITVVGTDYGGAVALRFVIPTKKGSEAVEAVGQGKLEAVKGGLPDGLALVGSGNLSGPDFKRDSGRWSTVAPSKAAGG